MWHIGVGWGEKSAWLAIYQGRWTNSGDLFKLSGNSYDLHLGVQGVDDFLLIRVYRQTYALDRNPFLPCGLDPHC